mgnify:CR=1 FL=1
MQIYPIKTYRQTFFCIFPSNDTIFHIKHHKQSVFKKGIDMKVTSLIHDVYTQTMLMARHQKTAKLFGEDFWGTQ